MIIYAVTRTIYHYEGYGSHMGDGVVYPEYEAFYINAAPALAEAKRLTDSSGATYKVEVLEVRTEQ